MHKKIALVCVLFALVGGTQAKQLLDKVVAVVNDSVITASELHKQVELSKKQILAQKMQMPKELILRKQVLEHLIEVNLQMQIAKQQGILVSDAELNQAIEKIAAVNHATLPQLREEVSRQGMSWHEYRENFRKEMLLAHVQQKVVAREVLITDEQVEQYLKTEGNLLDRSRLTYHLQNMVIPLSEQASPAQIKKAKSQADYLLSRITKVEDFNRLAIKYSNAEMALEVGDLGPRHLNELPALFAKEVIKMKVGQVVGPLRAGNGFQLIKLLAVAHDNPQQTVTLTHVRHILLKPDPSMLSKDSVKQANNIYQQLKAGKDFALMAKRYSMDSASAAKGGDLGWVSPDELVPEFEQAMNKLSLKELSHPVKTPFGWHLIEVLARKQQTDSPAFRKQQARQLLQQRKFAEAVQNWKQHIRAQAYINILEKDLT